jgi:hypothetical protein
MNSWFSSLKQAVVKIGLAISFISGVMISPLTEARDWLLDDTSRQQRPHKTGVIVQPIKPITFPKPAGSKAYVPIHPAHPLRPLLSNAVKQPIEVSYNDKLSSTFYAKPTTVPVLSETLDDELASHFARINAEIEQVAMAKQSTYYPRQHFYQSSQDLKPIRRLVYPVSRVEPPKSSVLANMLSIL